MRPGVAGGAAQKRGSCGDGGLGDGSWLGGGGGGGGDVTKVGGNVSHVGHVGQWSHVGRVNRQFGVIGCDGAEVVMAGGLVNSSSELCNIARPKLVTTPTTKVGEASVVTTMASIAHVGRTARTACTTPIAVLACAMAWASAMVAASDAGTPSRMHAQA